MRSRVGTEQWPGQKDPPELVGEERKGEPDEGCSTQEEVCWVQRLEVWVVFACCLIVIHSWVTFVHEGWGSPTACQAGEFIMCLISCCVLPTKASLKHREAMTFALFPSTFSSKVWDYGLRQRGKRKWTALNFPSFPAGTFLDFFFQFTLWPVQIAVRNPHPEKTEPEASELSGIRPISHFYLHPVLKT